MLANSKVFVGVVVPIPIFPELDTKKKLEEPETILNDPVPNPTEADTDPVAIRDKFNPTIADAGIPDRSAPDPENEPEITAEVPNETTLIG